MFYSSYINNSTSYIYIKLNKENISLHTKTLININNIYI